MKPVLHCGLAVLLGVVPVLLSANEAQRSSWRDHSLNVNRDLPIACKPGDLERMPGKSMGEVFGAQWPAQPEPQTPQAHSKARLLAVQASSGMTRGLPPQPGMVIAAVLVDGHGKAMKVVPICATDEGYDVATTRLLMRGKYQPATVDAQPIISVAMVVFRYRDSLYQGSSER
jgi:hypothetical protein